MQEYDRHLGSVNTITFIDENRRFVSTSDDKSLRIWEWCVHRLLFCPPGTVMAARDPVVAVVLWLCRVHSVRST